MPSVPLGGTPGEISSTPFVAIQMAVQGAQDLEKLLGEHDVAILLAFALGHTEDHAPAVDVG